MASTNQPLGTYVYSPDVKVYIKSASLKKTIDISEDIMNFQISRQTNASSTAQFTLSNHGFKYTPQRLDNPHGPYTAPTPIETMDRIVVYLKRDVWLQVFSGYVTNAPILTLIPEPIQIQAYCTLYKIQNTFWDIGNPSYQKLMPGLLMTSESGYQQFGDGGAAQGIANVLTEVVGWDPEKIHVSAIPAAFVAASTKVYTADTNSFSGPNVLPQNSVDTFVKALDGAGVLAGDNLINVGINGSGKGNYVTSTSVPKGLPQAAVAIPDGTYTSAILPPMGYKHGYSGKDEGIIIMNTDVDTVFDYYSATYKGGAKAGAQLQPVTKGDQDDDYWCVISWPYFLNTMGANNADTATVQQLAQQWLSDDGYNGKGGRHLLITSIANAKQVVVKASMAGDTNNQIVLSRSAWEYLAGEAVSYSINGPNGTTNGDFYAQNAISVTVGWTEPGKAVKGPRDNSALVGQLNSYGFQLGNTLAETKGGSVTYNSTTGIQATTQNPTGTATNAPLVDPGNGQSSISTIKSSNDWARLVLKLCGFPDNSWNVGFIANWISVENGPNAACHYIPGANWAQCNNPLNNGNATFPSRNGSGVTGAYSTLYEAAVYLSRSLRTVAEGGYGGYYEELGAIFDSKRRLQPNGKPYLSANYGLDPTDLTNKTTKLRYKRFCDAVSRSKWDGAKYSAASQQAALQNLNPPNYPLILTGPFAEGWSMFPGTNKGPGINAGSSTNTPVTPTTETNVSYSGVGTGSSFNTQFTPSQMDLETLALLGTPRAFVTDQPVLSSISNLAQASLRQFQSSPTGDFIAWFPDYWGVYGQAPALSIHDIEVVDFSLYHDDTLLTTHIAVSGDITNMGTEVGMIDWMMSNGIVTIQIDEVMAILFGFLNADGSPNTTLMNKTLSKSGSFSNDFLLRYGMRPLSTPVPVIRSHVTEFMFAWQKFMMNWGNQYTVQATFTFMPELYPGMRIRLEDHQIEVYVTAVTHSGDRQSGFQTTASVTTPIYRKSINDKPVPLHYGYPYSKVQNT